MAGGALPTSPLSSKALATAAPVLAMSGLQNVGAANPSYNPSPLTLTAV